MEYDRFLEGLRDVLNSHTLHGYHCARLTRPEVRQILTNGMQLPNGEMLHRRIRALEEANIIRPPIAERLKGENCADDSNRSGMIGFCFSPPHIAGQRGIERLFRSWGGEALYVAHERDLETGPILRRLGTPCIIEADVPISSLEVNGGLDDKVARRYLVNRGYEASGVIDHSDRAKQPIPAQNIRQVIRFPSEEFIRLTKCDSWDPPLV